MCRWIAYKGQSIYLDDCSRCWAPVDENAILHFDENNLISLSNLV